jgi:glycine cleavage system H lipoate-binding protein
MVVSFEFLDVGDNIEEGEIFAEIQSAFTVHEFLSPISGIVLAVNRSLTITLRLLTRILIAKDG